MAHRRRQRIRRVRIDGPRRGQKAADHEGDLVFVRPAPADHRLFDGGGGIFPNQEARGRKGGQSRPPGLAEAQGGPGVGVDEGLLARGFFGLKRGDDGPEARD